MFSFGAFLPIQLEDGSFDQGMRLAITGTRLGRLLTILLAVFSLVLSGSAQNVTTQQYGNARSGVQSQETVLQPSNVNSKSFGKLFSLPVAGHVYAEPLYMAGLTMADGTTHNVVLVATEQDNVYAFDADGNNPKQGYLWKKVLVGSGETWVSHTDVGNGNISPDIGITGTPVIDPATSTLYVVTVSKTTSGILQFFSRLHALSLVDGSEKLNGPTTINAIVPGTADGSSTVSFSAKIQNQRPGLSLAATPNGTSAASVFIAYASHGDLGPYHGWIISYSAADISQQTGAWCDTPNGLRGGIWMPGGAISSDDNGTVFAADGNGTFDGNSGGTDFGNSAFALTLNGSTLAPSSTFTPSEQAKLNSADYDMGTTGVILLPTQPGATHPRLAIAADKVGTLFLLNRDNLGGYLPTSEVSLQNFPIGTVTGLRLRDSLAFFDNTLYAAGEGAPLVAFPFDQTTERFTTTAAKQSTHIFGCSGCASGGTTPTISASGTMNGIVWALDRSGRELTPAILYAFAASTLGTELYNSSQAANGRDAGPVAIAFTSPVIANGHVFVPGVNSVAVYGELAQQPTVAIQATPSEIASGQTSTLTVVAGSGSSVTITGSDGSSYSLSATGGTVAVTPAATTTYTATATSSKGFSATSSVKVSVDVPTVTLTAAPVSINAGATSTLTVTATQSTLVSLTGSDNSTYTMSITGGTANVTPTVTTMYTATAIGNGGKITATATVTVGTPTVTISASPGIIIPGATATLTVSSTGATQLSITGSDHSTYLLAPPGGTVSVTPVATTTYTVTATAPSGTASAITQVTVKLPTAAIVASPAVIAPRGSSTLSVTASNASAVAVAGSDGSTYTLGATGGSINVTPVSTTTYTATATGGNQTATAAATVTITTLPAVSLTANPASITAGASSTLSVAASNTLTLVVNGSDGSTFSLSPAGGTHTVTPSATTKYTATATNTTGKATSVTTVTVTPVSGGGCLPSSAGILICQPGSGATTTSLVTVVAGARAAAGYIVSIRVYSDNIMLGTIINPAKTTTFQISQPFTQLAGTHHLVLVAYESLGAALTQGEYFTVSSGSSTCSVPGLPGVNVCSPTPGQTVASPVNFSAAAVDVSGSVNHLELWVDGKKLGNYSGSSMNANVALTSGLHAATVVEVDLHGAYLKSTPVSFTAK